jgi:class 3 adenylate cyclase/tetratricopeptide (TPR) repeat protein
VVAVCASCGREGGAGRFCEGCGAPLPQACPSCGTPVSADARFCGSCGVRLDERRRRSAEGERRQVAVLFCDVVESTPLSQHLDAEDYGQLILDVRELATATINGLGGTVGSYAGDGMAAWFGWPVAHEDDTALAVQAGLDIFARLGELNTTIEAAHGLRVAARVAVHVGPVVLRTDRADTPAFGDTVNIAARLQSFAAPDTLVISETAHRIAGRRFSTAFLGAPDLKGVERPLGVHRVDGPRSPDDEPSPPAFRAPLVGRDGELEQLLEAWSAAKRGIGGAVVITGEPGVGKSRLLMALRDALADEPHRWLELRCSPLGVNTAFRPVADMIRRGLGIRRADEPAEQRRILSAALPGELGRAERSLAALLGLETEGLPAPERFRHDLMEAVCTWLLALARDGPVVVAGEDLHWSDPSTLELAGMLQDRLAIASVLLVLTRRLEGRLGVEPSSEITLERLDQRDAHELARHLAAGHGLDPEVAERVAERSDGVPLFVEELVAAAGDSDDGGGLPTSLQSSLLARLDRLGPAREVAQIASVLGRSFPEQLLVAAADTPPNEVAGAVRRLTAAGIVESRASVDGLRYEFRHALIRDAAYESLLKRRRVELHLRVAQLLEERFAERVSTEPELLGHHLAHAQEPLRAARCFERAGRRAAGSAALAEAAAHYRRGLAQLEDAAPGPERERQEMWLGILLGNALMGLEGIGADSLRPVWQRAIELGERVGDAEELTAALNGLAVQEADNSDLDAAIALARRQIEIAEETGSRVARLRGHGTMGLALFYRGRGHEALEHLRTSSACYRPGDFQLVTFGVGHDQGIFARAMTSWALWWLGRPDAALREIREAVAQAEQLGSFLSLAMARHFLSGAHQLRRESEAAVEQARINAAFAHELGFRFWEGAALLTGGAERTRLGDRDGLGDVQRGLALLSEAGSRSGTSSGLATLAEAHHASGDSQAALATVDAALNLSNELGQHYWDPELMRLKAEFLMTLEPGAGERAEALLRDALTDATRRGAAAHALRAATALGRRLGEQGRAAEARGTVATALAAIEGGEETADVRDAHQLIDGLPTTILDREELR